MNNSLEKSIESLNIFGNHAKNLVLLAEYIINKTFNIKKKYYWEKKY